jgi:hypothetical protein
VINYLNPFRVLKIIDKITIAHNFLDSDVLARSPPVPTSPHHLVLLERVPSARCIQPCIPSQISLLSPEKHPETFLRNSSCVSLHPLRVLLLPFLISALQGASTTVVGDKVYLYVGTLSHPFLGSFNLTARPREVVS